jgi:hypothetical protein
LDTDEDKGARGLSTLAPWSRAVHKPIKNDRKRGSRGLAHVGCLPLWGRVGVTLAIPPRALWEGFLQSPVYPVRACRALFAATAGIMLAEVVDPETTRQIPEILTGLGYESRFVIF